MIRAVLKAWRPTDMETLCFGVTAGPLLLAYVFGARIDPATQPGLASAAIALGVLAMAVVLAWCARATVDGLKALEQEDG